MLSEISRSVQIWPEWYSHSSFHLWPAAKPTLIILLSIAVVLLIFLLSLLLQASLTTSFAKNKPSTKQKEAKPAIHLVVMSKVRQITFFFLHWRGLLTWRRSTERCILRNIHYWFVRYVRWPIFQRISQKPKTMYGLIATHAFRSLLEKENIVNHTTQD